MALRVRKKEDEGEAMADINVTPLVDIMLVLLIIFIITVQVAVQQVKITLPTATNVPTQTKPENITIVVDKDGNVYWNGKMLSGQEQLLNELRSVAREDPQPEVHIRGDINARYMYVGGVLVAAQRIGIRKIGFITIPDHPGAG
ncbi:MAG: biopolymer transporter ExbD [Proteobacteria bacterium]|nr:biopolymer transporter ExbD [Pseudomonadota bacterium]